MPVTLAQAKLNTQDDIQKGVIDEFRKESFILEHMTFDDAVSPGTAGATLTYGYTRIITQPTAAFRAINTEYAPQEMTKQRYTVDLKVFGGAFQIDRVLANTNGLIDEVDLQMKQKVKAARALFNDTVINGDSAVDANAFDGLNKAVTGTVTEYGTGAVVDLSTSALVDTNYKAFLDNLDEWLAQFSAKPHALMGNTKMIAKIRACARRSAMYELDLDNFGMQVESYNGIPLVDLWQRAGSTLDVVATVGRTVAATAYTGLTDLYGVCFGLDGFHAVSMANVSPVQVFMPPFDLPGAVKTGEVEMVSAVALKQTRAAGVFRNIKVS